MGSPITTWEGAEAYFTGAGSPGVLMFWLALSLIVVVAVTLSAMGHEKTCAKNLADSGYN